MPYLLALPVFCLAVAIALPIPFGNPAPVVALCVIAIGLVERDGLVVLIGLGMTLIALAVTGALVYTATVSFHRCEPFAFRLMCSNAIGTGVH